MHIGVIGRLENIDTISMFDAMQGTIARVKLAAYPPDIEIVVPRNICGTFEFNKIKELIEYGYDLCAQNDALNRR